MKIVSWGIIFVIIIFSFSFVNRVILNDKMEIMKEEIKYNNVLELATQDATSELKSQMNTIEGTYNETQEMMLTVAQKFFDSFSIGFGYYGGNSKESLVKMYVPALAMMSYDGLYMYTLEYVKDNAGNQYLEHTLKPEVKYAYYDGLSKINFTLDNEVILDKKIQTIDYSEPIMETIYATDADGNLILDTDGNPTIIGYEQQRIDGQLIYGLKDTNRGKVVDLDHYYDIVVRTDTSWQEKIGECTFNFKKEGQLCWTTNKEYKDAEGNVITNTPDKAIVYEKSFYMKDGIRYLLEEWRRYSDEQLLEQRLTEYTEDQLIFSQAIEAEISDEYGETNKTTTNGFTVWKTDKLNSSREYVTYLTRGNPENEGFVNLLTGEYEIGEFHKVRRETITNKIKENLEYYILLHNKFAQNNGITYTFTMPEIKDTDWENAITDMSVFAFIQGIPMVSGKYYNNYGVAGAKVVNQEKFYGIPPEVPIVGQLPTYYSNKEIGSAKEYLFERNNARILADAKEAADYGYYPNIDNEVSVPGSLERDVWNIDIIKEGFNCVTAGDIITLPIIVSDDIIPSEIKWAEGTKSRYYFSSAGSPYNSGTKNVSYGAGSITDSSINENILDGSNITWQYVQKDGQRKILILVNVGQARADLNSQTFTIFVRDVEGNSEVDTITLNVLNNMMSFNVYGGTELEDSDTNPNNTISGTFQNRDWDNLLKDVNGNYMAYWIQGKLTSSTINGYYDQLYNGNYSSGAQTLTNTGIRTWSFNVTSYGYYTVFAWDCTGAPVMANIIILPSMQITYKIEAYNETNLIETISYDATGNVISGSTEIEEQITRAKVIVEINRTTEQLEFVEYKKGNFDIIANADAGVGEYIVNTGTNIKGTNEFWLTENNYYTIYAEDIIGTKDCVQINFELITSAFIPNFNDWIIPDIEYQQYYKPYFIENGNTWTNSSYRSYWNAETNIDGKVANDYFYRPILRTDTTLTFGGYTSRNCRDVIFTNADAQYEIVFKYTINDANVSYHSSKGAGFLFDCNITTTNRSDGNKNYTLNSGYLLLYESSYIKLYKITNSTNLTAIRNTGYTPSVTVASGTKLSGGIHETRLEIRQINNTQQSLILKEKNSSGNWQEIMNVSIEHNKQTENAYGVIMMHNSHSCSTTSAFKFNNMSIIQKAYTY